MKYRSNFHIQGGYIDKLLNKEDYAKSHKVYEFRYRTLIVVDMESKLYRKTLVPFQSQFSFL
jgi:hypothetical protein